MKEWTTILTTWCQFFNEYFHCGPCNKNWSEPKNNTIISITIIIIIIIVIIVISEFMTFYLLASAIRPKTFRTRSNAVQNLHPASHKDPLPHTSAFLTLSTSNASHSSCYDFRSATHSTTLLYLYQKFPASSGPCRSISHIHKNPPLVNILNLMNPVQTLSLQSCNIHFDVLLQSRSRSSSR